MRYLAILLLTGCQLTVARLPSPIDPEAAKLLGDHQRVLEELVKDYNDRKQTKK